MQAARWQGLTEHLVDVTLDCCLRVLALLLVVPHDREIAVPFERRLHLVGRVASMSHRKDLTEGSIAPVYIRLAELAHELGVIFGAQSAGREIAVRLAPIELGSLAFDLIEGCRGFRQDRRAQLLKCPTRLADVVALDELGSLWSERATVIPRRLFGRSVPCTGQPEHMFAAMRFVAAARGRERLEHWLQFVGWIGP